MALAAMWIAAIAAMLGIYVSQERPSDARLRRADAAPVRTPDDEAAPLPAPDHPAPRAPETGPPLQFRHDRWHRGRSPYAGPRTGHVLWSVETGGPVSAQPVVGEDGTIHVGSHDHHFYAIGPDGRVLWRRDLGGPIYSTPVRIGDRVFVGSDAAVFFCLDAASGRVIWYLRTDDDADTGIALAPDGTLVFAAGPDVFAVTQEGEVRWRFRTGLKVFSAPAIDDDGTVYVGSQDNHIYAIAPDGRMRWRYRTRDDVDGSPAIGDDGTIYVGSDDHRVYALRRDGTLRWSADVGADVRAPIGLGASGAIYVGVLAPHARVVALDAAGGQERWEFAIAPDATGAGVASGPLVDRDGNLYFGADDDFVYSLSPDGRLRWFVRTGGDVDGEPVITPEGILLIGSDDHRLYAIGDAGSEAAPARDVGPKTP